MAWPGQRFHQRFHLKIFHQEGFGQGLQAVYPLSPQVTAFRLSGQSADEAVPSVYPDAALTAHGPQQALARHPVGEIHRSQVGHEAECARHQVVGNYDALAVRRAIDAGFHPLRCQKPVERGLVRYQRLIDRQALQFVVQTFHGGSRLLRAFAHRVCRHHLRPFPAIDQTGRRQDQQVTACPVRCRLYFQFQPLRSFQRDIHIDCLSSREDAAVVHRLSVRLQEETHRAVGHFPVFSHEGHPLLAAFNGTEQQLCTIHQRLHQPLRIIRIHEFRVQRNLRPKAFHPAVQLHFQDTMRLQFQHIALHEGHTEILSDFCHVEFLQQHRFLSPQRRGKSQQACYKHCFH